MREVISVDELKRLWSRFFESGKIDDYLKICEERRRKKSKSPESGQDDGPFQSSL